MQLTNVCRKRFLAGALCLILGPPHAELSASAILGTDEASVLGTPFGKAERRIPGRQLSALGEG